MLKKIELQHLENTPFHQACAEGNLQKCQELFAKNPQILDKIHPEYLTTGLEFAVQNNQVQVVKWLLGNNASLYRMSPNKKIGKSLSQLVDLPFDKDKRSCQTAFSFCSNAEIYSLLSQSSGFFTQPQLIVVLCERIICLLDPELSDVEFISNVLVFIQSLVTKTIHYTDKSIIALNALANAYFDLGVYPQAKFCYESVKHLLGTKKYQQEACECTEFNLVKEINFADYNINVVQLKINEINGYLIDHEAYTKNFKNIGDIFIKIKNHLEAEQCYKKSILHCKVGKKELQTKLYLELLESCSKELNNSFNQEGKVLLVKIQEYFNIVLESARETPNLNEHTALKLQIVLDSLSYIKEFKIIVEFCTKFIAMDIKNNDAAWIYLDIYLIISQLNLQIKIEDDVFKNILDKSPEFAKKLADLQEYWIFLNLLYRLGSHFSKINQYIYAEQCYKTVFDLSDDKQLDNNGYNTNELAYTNAGLALIKIRLKLGMEITTDIVDKFLAIKIQEGNYNYDLRTIITLWKEAADLLFTNKNYTPAEQFYKKIFDLISSANWKSEIAKFNDDHGIPKLITPIEVGFNLVTLQIIRGVEIQEVLNVLFRKMKHMNQFIETVDKLDEQLEISLLKNGNLLFNNLGETISREQDDQTFHLATQCFLTAFKAALRNDKNDYSDVNPTLQKLLTHYKNMGKQYNFIKSLLKIFSSSLSPVNIKEIFHSIYVNCINATDNANKIEIQFFTAAFNCMEKFANKSGRKSKNNYVVLWQDFFEMSNNKNRFLQLHDKLQNHQQHSVKRKSSEDLNGPIIKKSKTEIIPIEDESIIIEESDQNQHSLNLVTYTYQQPIPQKIPYSYSKSANAFNGFFSIQQDNKKKSKHKSAHHFDFDQTLTKVHVKDWKITPPSPEACKAFLRSETIPTLQFILQSGNYVSIITNGTAYRISWILLQAGLTQKELDKIPIKAAESPTIVVENFKPVAIRDLAEEWHDAKNHYFYDDREDFCMEVWRMKPEFENKRKNLHVTHVSREANDCSHLSYAWQKAAEFSNEKESMDNTELTLK